MSRLATLSVALLALFALASAAHTQRRETRVQREEHEKKIVDNVLHASSAQARLSTLLGSLVGRQTCSKIDQSCTTTENCCENLFCNRYGWCRKCRNLNEQCSLVALCCFGRTCIKGRCKGPKIIVVPPTLPPTLPPTTQSPSPSPSPSASPLDFVCALRGEACVVKSDCCPGFLCLPSMKCGKCKTNGKFCKKDADCCQKSPKPLTCYQNRCRGCQDAGEKVSKLRPCCPGSSPMGGICVMDPGPSEAARPVLIG